MRRRRDGLSTSLAAPRTRLGELSFLSPIGMRRCCFAEFGNLTACTDRRARSRTLPPERRGDQGLPHLGASLAEHAVRALC
jgi:hypothetical protein